VWIATRCIVKARALLSAERQWAMPTDAHTLTLELSKLSFSTSISSAILTICGLAYSVTSITTITFGSNRN
jgi:hypothetical protein